VTARDSDKRRDILVTAEALFSRHGPKRVTVTELCEEAGVSKMTFYKHFRSKSDLVHHLHDELMERGFAEIDEIDARTSSFPDKIAAIGRWKQEFMSRLGESFFQELMDVGPSVEAYRRRYLTMIAAARAAGDVREDVDPEFFWLVVERASRVLADGSWREVVDDLGEAQRQLRTVLWYGLLARDEAAADGAAEG
jgi:AcrR family transcriptional regulator